MANSKEDLSDVTIVQNSDGMRSVCSTWKGAADSADLGSIDVTSIFAPLVENGIAVSYVSSLKAALGSITSMVAKLISAIGSNVDAQEAIDDKGKNDASGGKSGKYRNYGGAGNNGSSGGGSSSSAVPAGNSIDTTSYDIKDTESNLDILKKYEDYVTKLDEYQKLDVMTNLYSIVKADTYKYLYEEQYGALLKKKLLESPKVDADLKKIISEMDENEVQVLLQNLLVNNAEVSDFSQMIISIYDNEFKQEFVGATSADSIESITKVYTFLSKEKDVQGYLSKIYFGDVSNVDDYAITFTRVLVDTLAEKSGISYEELLSDSRYSGALKEATVDIAKSFTALSINSSVTSSAA